MLLYVIPLVILIIVLIVVKKRQDSQESGKTTTAKGKAQKVSVTKKTVTKTKEVADTVVAKKKTTPLSADQRNKIEALIRENNFFSAEAQINQALNKDNSQHELYLLLLDIHILQKDEFAISQLINHLRSLELDDFLEQALAKKQAHEKETASTRDTIDFKTESTISPVAEPAAIKETKNTADFDALMNDSAATTNELAFDHSQQDQPAPQTAAVEEIKPLDFNTLSLDSTATATAPAEEIKPLDFNNFNLNSSPVEETKVEAAPVQEIQPLDFSFSLDTATPEHPATAAVPTTANNTASADDKPEFNFDFSVAETTPTAEVKVAAEETKPSLDLDFNLEPAITPDAPVVEAPAAKATGVSFDISNISATTAKVDQNDPLVQSFPELIEVDEIHLNLELAEQYIQLGAFESARELLAEQEAKYTPTQKQQADQLLNQIAS